MKGGMSKMTNDNTNIAIVLAIVALLISIIGAGYAVTNKPADVNLDGIEANKALINILKSDVSNLGTGINDLKVLYLDVASSDIDQDDLDDLEDDIDNLQDDINDNEELLDDMLGCYENSPNITAVLNCLKFI